MFASLLITFRETLEVALVVGIVLSFLIKTRQYHLKRYVWIGVLLGSVVAISVGVSLRLFLGGFEGKVEELFEGVMMFITAGFISWMILWVHRQKEVAKKLQVSAANYIAKGFPLGLTLLIFTSTLREGIETVLYLQAVHAMGASNQLLGAVSGLIVAGVLSYALFRFSIKVNLHQLLKLSGAVLLLFAAGLVSHGVHEFQEAGMLPIFRIDPLINLSDILSHESFFGSLLSILFGYTATPTMLQLLSYGGYILFIFLLEVYTDRLLLRRSN